MAEVAEHLILRLEAPLQAWGDVAMDPRRPTRAFPSRSGLAGLLASALGWRYRDADRTTALQDALRYAVREDRCPQVIRDYQTADLGAIGIQGWTRWGLEKRAGSAKEGTQILEKSYLADGAFTVALALSDGAEVALSDGLPTLEALEAALRRPARPLFLGRRGCPPSTPLLGPPGQERVDAPTPAEALLQAPLRREFGDVSRSAIRDVRIWYDASDGSLGDLAARAEVLDVWDRRDFRSNRFGGSRRLVSVLLPAEQFAEGA